MEKEISEKERGWFRDAATTWKCFLSFPRRSRRFFLCVYGVLDGQGTGVILLRALLRLRR